ncbi:hypothetical protein, partial [Nonomuraea harbinensis]|uniref:hypothetical protein n=1 Tax=Nonomuraea harbinensis TaxID=1286938 RepID=UPI001C5E6B71
LPIWLDRDRRLASTTQPALRPESSTPTGPTGGHARRTPPAPAHEHERLTLRVPEAEHVRMRSRRTSTYV